LFLICKNEDSYLNDTILNLTRLNEICFINETDNILTSTLHQIRSKKKESHLNSFVRYEHVLALKRGDNYKDRDKRNNNAYGNNDRNTNINNIDNSNNIKKEFSINKQPIFNSNTNRNLNISDKSTNYTSTNSISNLSMSNLDMMSKTDLDSIPDKDMLASE